MWVAALPFQLTPSVALVDWDQDRTGILLAVARVSFRKAAWETAEPILCALAAYVQWGDRTRALPEGVKDCSVLWPGIVVKLHWAWGTVFISGSV